MADQAATTSITTWQDALSEEKKLPYFQSILQHLIERQQQGVTIYPKQADIFNALRYTPLEDVKVVIVGQDPYHGPGQAHGLCFSVQEGIAKPPSLINIFQEITADLGLETPKHGSLAHWANQGVLLLNTVLTVERGRAHSHANIGWERFTDKIIDVLNNEKENLVFLLWGSHAQRKCANIDNVKHLVLRAPHPSPLSAHRGFFGCKHFSKCNQWLIHHNKLPINWA